MQWHSVHSACCLIILVNQSVNLTMLKELLNLGVVSAFAGSIFENTKFETGLFDDFQSKPDNPTIYAVLGLQEESVSWNVILIYSRDVNICEYIWRKRNSGRRVGMQFVY